MKKLLIIAFLIVASSAFAADCGSIVKAQVDAGVTCNLENQMITNIQASASNPMTTDDTKLLSLLLKKLRGCASKAIEICEQINP